MDPKAYLEMAQTEDHHWWFVARRAVLKDFISAFELPALANILEVGVGTGGDLASKIATAGLRLERISYFNTLLFPFGVLTRLLNRLTHGRVGSDAAVPMTHVNFMLRHIFSLEKALLRRMNLPFGMSLVAVLRPE